MRRMRGPDKKPRVRRSTPLATRFWKKVTPGDPNECWLWQAKFVRPDGYGQMGRGRASDGMVLAHRASWEIHFGPIPDEMCVCHKCDVRLCVNPAHLFLGTRTENLTDMYKKGRGVYANSGYLSPEDVAEIRALAGGRTHREIAKDYGVSTSNITRVLNRVTWRDLGDEHIA